jgi:hypothetical protein
MKKFFTSFKDGFGGLSKWAGGLFKDETGTPSSKRFVGIICALMLCITMYHNSFSTVDIAPAQYLVDAVALLAFSTLGLSSVDKFIKTRKDINSATTTPVKEETATEVVESTTCTNCGQEPCSC